MKYSTQLIKMSLLYHISLVLLLINPTTHYFYYYFLLLNHPRLYPVFQTQHIRYKIHL